MSDFRRNRHSIFREIPKYWLIFTITTPYILMGGIGIGIVDATNVKFALLTRNVEFFSG